MNTTPDLADELAQFTGSEHFYPFSVLFPKFLLTDGAEYLAETAGAFWLMDMIASHMRGYEQKDTFATARLKKRQKTWLFTLDDGNGNVFARQIIQYSDFPIEEFMLFVGWDGDYWTIMLPSEY